MTPPLAQRRTDSVAIQSRPNTRIPTDMIHRPHDLVGVGTAVISLPLTHVRERSADWRYVLVWHLVEGALVPCGHAASRRFTVASSTPRPSRQVRTGDFHLRDPGRFCRASY